MCFGVGEKQNNRNESREVILGNQIMRVLHDIFNQVTKKMAQPIPEEVLSKSGNYAAEKM